MWLARDRFGSLFLYKEKSIKYYNIWVCITPTPMIQLDSTLFPEVKLSDEGPIKVKLVIDE